MIFFIWPFSDLVCVVSLRDSGLDERDWQGGGETTALSIDADHLRRLAGDVAVMTGSLSAWDQGAHLGWSHWPRVFSPATGGGRQCEPSCQQTGEEWHPAACTHYCWQPDWSRSGGGWSSRGWMTEGWARLCCYPVVHNIGNVEVEMEWTQTRGSWKIKFVLCICVCVLVYSHFVFFWEEGRMVGILFFYDLMRWSKQV